MVSVDVELFPGNATYTVHARGEEFGKDPLAALVNALAGTSGRVLWGGWPTGVSMSPAMEHGGPRPAATVEATGVGPSAFTRFLRGVSCQGTPQEFPPPCGRAAPGTCRSHATTRALA